MNKYNKELFANYKPTTKTLLKDIQLTSQIGDLNARISSITSNKLISSRLFSFIESKYSSKIEGIYTGLFDIVNTGLPNKQENIIKPLVEALLYREKQISIKMIDNIADKLNVQNDTSQRWDSKFGVYKRENNKSIKIYEPPLVKEEVQKELRDFMSVIKTGDIISNIIKNHIWFEKIHPYYDGNGRIGRLIMNKSLSYHSESSDVLPLSWAIFKNKQIYYDAFDAKTNVELNAAIISIMNIMQKMIITITSFLDEVEQFVQENLHEVMSLSTRMTKELATNILLNLQTKASDLIKNKGLNPRTVSSIFEKMTKLDFNEKKIGREKLYWNISLETIIELYFSG